MISADSTVRWGPEQRFIRKEMRTWLSHVTASRAWLLRYVASYLMLNVKVNKRKLDDSESYVTEVSLLRVTIRVAAYLTYSALYLIVIISHASGDDESAACTFKNCCKV